MTVVWSPRAIGHLADLRAYIARENPGAAARAATTLRAAVDRLAELPNLGRPGRVAGTRELVVPGVIPYRVRGERLEIIAVFHGRQLWPTRLTAVVEALDLKEGDQIEIRIAGEREFEVIRDRTKEKALARLRRLRRPLPAGFSFSREEANER